MPPLFDEHVCGLFYIVFVKRNYAINLHFLIDLYHAERFKSLVLALYEAKKY